MKDLNTILRESAQSGASDVYIVPGATIRMRVDAHLQNVTQERLMPDQSEALLQGIYALTKTRPIERLLSQGDDDFSFSLPGVGRFRCCAYMQRGSLAAVLRVVRFELPDPQRLGIPQSVMELADTQSGMVLVTGPAGSGKSTTLACLIDHINRERQGHIITLEDPIEYLHSHNGCIVSQREMHSDSQGFAVALRAALRQAPDVIMLGEMRDYDTMATALTAAETGHLLFSSLHTLGAAKSIDRIVDVFPANAQQQGRVQLGTVLRAVVSQQLVPTLSGGLTPVFEVMRVTPAIANLIREGKTFQIDNAIAAGGAQGMMTMDQGLAQLVQAKVISRQTALDAAQNRETLERRLR